MGQIIYIHGRGFGATHSMGWESGLVTGLERAGYEISLEEVEGVSTPISYAAFLDPAVDPGDAQRPEHVRQQPSSAAVDAFVERQRTLRSRVGEGYREERVDRAVKQAASNDRIAEQVIGQRFRDVRRYVSDEARRERILNHIFQQLPERGSVVLIGHSLGSIIALDLVRRWPEHLHIDLLLTLGSPAALRPMQKHLHGLVDDLPRALLGGWVNIYDPSDPVTGGSGLEPYFADDVVDHRVQNGGLRGNHGAERHLDQVTAGVLIGPHVGRYLSRDFPPFTVPEDASAAAAMFDAALACWMRHRLTRRMPAGSSRRARRLLASETLRAQASRTFGLDPDADLRHHVPELEEVVRPHLPATGLVKLQLQLRSAALFAPFVIGVERDEVFGALIQLAEEVGWDAGRIQKVDRAMIEAREAQKARQNRVGALVLGSAAVGVAALATGGFALVAAPGVAGAAFVTSGLAGIGSLVGGGMTAGLFVTAGVGAATSLLARSAFGLMSALEVREEIIKIHAEVLIHRWEGDDESARELLGELRELRTVAAKEARLHSSVDEGGPKSDAAKDWAEKERILNMAIEALS
jgi:hypothetical protein